MPDERAEADAERFTERWIAKSLDITPLTEDDRRQVVEGIRRVYRSQRVPWPDHVVWVRSPFELGFRSESPDSLIERWRKDPARRSARRKAVPRRIFRGILNLLTGSMRRLIRILLRIGLVVGLVVSSAAFLLFFGALVLFVLATVSSVAVNAGSPFDLSRGDLVEIFLALLGGCVASLFLLVPLGNMIDDEGHLKALSRPKNRGGTDYDKAFEPEDLRARGSSDSDPDEIADRIDTLVASAVSGVWPTALAGVRGVRTGENGVAQGFVFTRKTMVDGMHGRIWRMEYEPSVRSDRDRDLLEGVALAYRAAVWTAYRGLALICEPPVELHTERVGDRYQLHNDDGPAIVWAGAPEHDRYFVHGQAIPGRIYAEDVSIADLHAERHEPFRRVAIERMGWLRYVEKAELRLVATTLDPADERVEHRLYDLPNEPSQSRRVLVTVRRAGSLGTVCSTGGLVPADLKAPLEALAWRYGTSVEEYRRFAPSVRGGLLLVDADVLAVEASAEHPWLSVPSSGVELRNHRSGTFWWRLLPGDDSPGIRWMLSRSNQDPALLGHLYVPPGQTAHVMQGDESAGSAVGPGGYAVRQQMI